MGRASAQGADLEKFDAFHVAKVRSVTSAAIAPDGSKVAYVLSVPRRLPAEEDGPAWAELHVVSREGKSKPYLTGEVNVADVQWTARRTGDLVPRQAGQG